MTAQVCVSAPAKINLHLEVLGLRGDGFHELAMVMQSIDLADQLVIDRRHQLNVFRLLRPIRCLRQRGLHPHMINVHDIGFKIGPRLGLHCEPKALPALSTTECDKSPDRLPKAAFAGQLTGRQPAGFNHTGTAVCFINRGVAGCKLIELLPKILCDFLIAAVALHTKKLEKEAAATQLRLADGATLGALGLAASRLSGEGGASALVATATGGAVLTSKKIALGLAGLALFFAGGVAGRASTPTPAPESARQRAGVEL